jgi:replicative DNA helicase
MLAEYQVICKILQTKDYGIIKTNNLTSDYFYKFKEQFIFIEEHYRKFGVIPDILTVYGKFPQFQVQEVGETVDYLVDKLYDESTFEQFTTFWPKLADAMKQDSRVGYEVYKQGLDILKPKCVCKGVDIIKNAYDRYELFINRANDLDNRCISTGLVELDEILGGWEYGEELVTIVARTNQGKSWLLMKFLAEAWLQGKRVGLYSGEMSHIKLGYRFDALFNHFSNRALVQGAQTDGYKEYIENLRTNFHNPFTIITQKEFGGRPTVQKIRNFQEDNGFDIIGIDQFSLMEDGRASSRDQTRIRLAHIAEDLFLLSTEYKIPILGLAQANREGAKKEGETDAPGLENIKESDDIAHNSSKCIGMRQSNFGLVLDIIKNREGRVGDKLLYSWDIDVGHFSYIPSAGDAAMPSTRQQVIQQDKQVFAPATFNPF